MMENVYDSEYSLWIRSLAVLLAPFRAKGYTVKKTHTEKFDYVPTGKYEDMRGSIVDGDLIFCGGEYAFSKVIRYLSGRSKVSHVGIVYWWNGRLMILESVEPDGVRIVPVSQYINNYENSGMPYNGRIFLARDRRLHVMPKRAGATVGDVRQRMVQIVLKTAADLLNRESSIKDVLQFFVQGCTGRLKHVDNEQFLCSEFVAKCYSWVGLDYEGDGRGFVAPEHIAMSENVEVLIELV